MKRTLLSSVFSGMLLLPAFSQSTLILQPDAAAGKDAVLHGLASEVNNNWGSITQLCMSAWTFSGTPGITRGIVAFDLSSILPGAVINSATLELYAWDQTGGFGQHSALSGTNDFYVQRITTAWNESTVTWNTAPGSTTTNQVTAPGTTNPNQDYSINVTALVQDMVNDPTNSHGFHMQLVTESYYRRINFCTSDHGNGAKRPKLTINYSPAGISENSLQKLDFDVFPNPTVDHISIKNIKQGKYELKIMNLLGEQVYSENISGNEAKISCLPFPGGEYIIIIGNGEAAGVRRITVQ